MSVPATELCLLVAQSEVRTAHEIDPANPQFNCGGYLDLIGDLRVDLLERAAWQVAEECEALRLRLRTDHLLDDQPDSSVTISDYVPPLEVIDVSRPGQGEAAALSQMAVDLAGPVRLDGDSLVRLVLFRLSTGRNLFYLRYHHFLLDGYGQILYLRRLARVYSALAGDQQSPPSPFGRLSDLTDEESAYYARGDAGQDREYWLRTMADPPARMDLGGSPSVSRSGVLRRSVCSPFPMRSLHEAAAARGTHWSVIVIAALAAYLRKLTADDDLVIGFPVRARTTRTALTTPAMMSNELPLRLHVTPSMTVDELVTQVAGRIGELLAHQRHRGEDLYRALRASGASSELPSVVANVIPFDSPLSFGNCTATLRQLSTGPVRGLSLDFYGGAHDGALGLIMNADAGGYGESDLDAHQARLDAFLRTVIEAPGGAPVGELDVLTPAERTMVLAEFNATTRDYDLATTLPALFASQATRTPQATAVSSAEENLTYAELLDRTHRLAAHLIEHGVRPGDVVGVHDVRSTELMVALLAVHRAGAAYLPLDPELPAARLRFQVRDAGVRLVLSRSTLAGALADDGGGADGGGGGDTEKTGAETIAVDTVLPGLTAADPPDVAIGPDHPAYVIYTSGSTGQPKGVVVPHRGVVNRLAWMRQDYEFGPGDCVLQKTSIGFDVSVWELFLPLITGARLHLLPPGAQGDPHAVARAVAEHGVTVLHFVPSMLDLFLDDYGGHDLSAVRHVFCSGEALRPVTVAAFFDRFAPGDGRFAGSAGGRQIAGSAGGAVQLHNLYGPTEASVDVTAWRCLPGADPLTVPIGRPVANTQIYVLDAAGRPTPVGVPGELHIGGVQVADGYLNRAELTAARFIPNPFGPGTLYRTGDLARWRTDGAVEFLGRTDHQVKVHGYRIEPDEVEAALLADPAVRQAVVTAVGEGSERRLVGYIVPSSVTSGVPSGPALDRDALRRRLAEQLPSYQVPAVLMVLDALPLLPNGKLDRGALPAPDAAPAGDAPAVPPSTPREQLLHGVWQEVLRVDGFGVEDSFFALGGDSMLAIRVRTALERHHRLTFTVAELFRDPTIRRLAALLRPLNGAANTTTAPFGLLDERDRGLLPVGLDDAYPLSSMQAGMLYHSEYQEAYQGQSSVYRVVTSIRVAAPFDLDRLRSACRDTVARHPQLRCSFDLTRYSEPLQLVHSRVDLPVVVADDLGGRSEAERSRAVEAFVDQVKHTVFDLASPPLLRFTVHPCGPDAFQLTVVEHHVLLDGWSDVVMLEEVLDRYRAALGGQPLALAELGSSYRDFIAAERAVLADPVSRKYWTEALRGAEPTTLFHRLGRPTPGTVRTKRFGLDLPADLADGLRAMSRSQGLPLKSLLVAAHVMVLATVSGQDEVITGLVANARLEEPSGDEVVGVFLNTLPLRLDVEGTSLIELAHAALAFEQESAPHRRYPFGQIQRDLAAPSSPRGGIGTPSALDGLASYVNFMDFHRGRYRGGGSELGVSIGVADTNYPLAVDFLVEPGQGTLQGWLDCDTEVLPERLCDRLTGYYRRALEALVADPGQPTLTVDLLGPDEHAELASWDGPVVEYDRTATLHGAFEEQARRTLDALALSHGWDEITYGDLDAAANRLGHRLVDAGVRRGDLVGVSVHRGVDLVVALLGVLKAGAAYVPLDATFPEARLRGIAADAGIACLVVAGRRPEGLTAPVVVDLHAEAAALAALPATPVDVAIGVDVPTLDDGVASVDRATPGVVRGSDRAYVMYTSGSTGAPKGAIVSHRNVVNFCLGMDHRVGCTPSDVVLAVTSVSFDISVLELLWPLTRGARVVVADERIIENLAGERPHSLRELCARHGVTLMQGTPSLLSAVAAEPEALTALSGLRALLVGGEAFPSGLARRLLDALPGTRLLNMYGPTETTIWSTVHELDRRHDADMIPIGTPIPNTPIRVLDGHGRDTPAEVAGELWIGGDGVTEGYLGRADLTADRFVSHGGRRFYRSGDRVRRGPAGVLEFLGRVDRQIKIHGHRVEPDEVESVLSRHPGLDAVAVIAVPGPSGPELVAYVTPTAVRADTAAEQAAQQAHVGRWTEVWQETYQPDQDQAVAEFAGWTSSYTGEPIPAEQMREWLGHTVERITASAPQVVADVGVGVGLVLRALAHRTTEYHALDISPAALAAAARCLGDRPLPGHVRLVRSGPEYLATLPADSLDAVVLNSVVQYFPSQEYLHSVLLDAVRVVRPGGTVHVGDVRGVEMLPEFHTAVTVHRSPALRPIEEVRTTAARLVRDEPELCLSPAFFRRFATKTAEATEAVGITGTAVTAGTPGTAGATEATAVGEVRVELKRGRADNELTAFRFDVMIKVGPTPPVVPVTRLDWSDVPGGVDGLPLVLAAKPGTVQVCGIPNRRLVRDVAAVRAVASMPGEATVWDLNRLLWDIDDGASAHPQDLVDIARRAGRVVRLTVPASGRLDTIDARFDEGES